MRETEITVEVLEEKQTLIEKLENCGFSMTCEFTMNDKYYSPYPIELLTTKKFEEIIKNSFLLRSITRTEDNKTEELNFLIYKDKQFDKEGNVISEEKVQTHIDNAKKHAKIFELAGYKPYANLISSNFVYKKEDVEFAVQEVEGLGLFIEFEEYESISHLPPDEKIEILKNTLLQYGLTLGNDFNCKKLAVYINKNK